MWPLNLYWLTSAAGIERQRGLAVADWFETLQALAPLERAVAAAAVTVVLAIVVVGVVPDRGVQAVAKTRRSPVISGLIGVPSVLVVAGLATTGYLILGTSIGTFFGMLFLLVGATMLPAGAAVGYVAVGRTISARLGRDRLWAGVLAGGLLAGLAALSIPAALGLTAIAVTVGTGATVRILFGSGGTSSPDERTVPPANKV